MSDYNIAAILFAQAASVFYVKSFSYKQLPIISFDILLGLLQIFNRNRIIWLVGLVTIYLNIRKINYRSFIIFLICAYYYEQLIEFGEQRQILIVLTSGVQFLRPPLVSYELKTKLQPIRSLTGPIYIYLLTLSLIRNKNHLLVLATLLAIIGGTLFRPDNDTFLDNYLFRRRGHRYFMTLSVIFYTINEII